MAKGKTSNKTQKAHYASYKAEERHEKNKLRKLERHVAKTPNDKQAEKALFELEENGVKYTRKRKSIKPNDTVQRRVRRVMGFSPNRNTFYAQIQPAVPQYAVAKKDG